MKCYLLPCLLLAPLLPTDVAQYAVAALFALLAIMGLKVKLLFLDIQWKALEAFLFMPAVITALNTDISLILRLLPIAFLVACFPYNTLTIAPSLLRRSAQLGIVYCFTTQALLAISNPVLLAFREHFYSIEINSWNYGETTTLLQGFGEFRAAGLWYNPNVLAGNVFILYLALYSSFLLSSPSHKVSNTIAFFKHNWFLSLIVLYSLFLTGTRTYAFCLMLFWMLLLLAEIQHLLQMKIKYATIIIAAISIVGFAGIFSRLAQGFSALEQGSLSVKNQILFDYINSVSALNLFFGSGSSIQFDAEFGYWIGLGGLSALAGVFLLYLMLIKKGNFFYVFPPIASILVAGFGNTQLFGLMTATLMVPVIISLSRVATIPSKLASWQP